MVATPEYPLGGPGGVPGGVACYPSDLGVVVPGASTVGVLGSLGTASGAAGAGGVASAAPSASTHSAASMSQLGTVYATKRRRRNGKRLVSTAQDDLLEIEPGAAKPRSRLGSRGAWKHAPHSPLPCVHKQCRTTQHKTGSSSLQTCTSCHRRHVEVGAVRNVGDVSGAAGGNSHAHI